MAVRRQIVASAPSRIDLAGGTLDIWPISMLVPRATTVNLALELRATATVCSQRDSRVSIKSVDRRRSVTRRLPLEEGSLDGPLPLLLRLASSCSPKQGLSLVTHALAPAGAGLGGSSTLAVATGAALARWSGERLSRERLLRRVMNHEASLLGVPTGNQDYLAAIHGGLSIYHHEADGTRREKLDLPPGLQRRLVLCYTGQPRDSGFSNWEMFRRFVEGERRTVARMESIAGIAREMGDALRAGELDEVGRLVGEEGRLRYRLAPSVATPALRAAGKAAAKAGALGSKVCGAGGGGCLVAFAADGNQAQVSSAIAETGAQILNPTIARRGLLITEKAIRPRR